MSCTDCGCFRPCWACWAEQHPDVAVDPDLSISGPVCALCHGSLLEGTPEGPSLAVLHAICWDCWRDETSDDEVQRVIAEMARHPLSLGDTPTGWGS